MAALPKPEGKVKMLSELKPKRPDPPKELYVYRIPVSFRDIGDGFVTPNYTEPPEFLGFFQAPEEAKAFIKKRLFIKVLPRWVLLYRVNIEEFLEGLVEKLENTEYELRDAREELEDAEEEVESAKVDVTRMEDDDTRAAGVLRNLQVHLEEGINQFERDEIIEHLAQGPYLGPGYTIAKVLRALIDANPTVPDK